LKIRRYGKVTSIKTRREKTGQTIVKVFHWEKPTFGMPQRSRTHARTFFSSDRDRVFYGKKRKAFLQTAKTIFEKYTDSINTTGQFQPDKYGSLQNIFLIVSNLVECLTFYVLFAIRLFIFQRTTRVNIVEVRIITNITGTNSIFRDHLFSTDMILRYLMCTQRDRYVAAEYIDTSRLQCAYV